LVIIVVGLAAALLGALANALGIGNPGFGWHQVLLIVVGLVVALVGVVVILRAPGPGGAPGADQ
jgi:hypothetical protein